MYHHIFEILDVDGNIIYNVLLIEANKIVGFHSILTKHFETNFSGYKISTCLPSLMEPLNHQLFKHFINTLKFLPDIFLLQKINEVEKTKKEEHYYSDKIDFWKFRTFFDIHRNFFFSLKTRTKNERIMIKEKSRADVRYRKAAVHYYLNGLI